MPNVRDKFQAAIDTQEIRIASLESKLAARQPCDGPTTGLIDRINYHLGVVSGLRQAMFILETEEL